VALPDIPIFGAFLHRLVIGLAFLALASPSAGPLLDHHFAERQPDHGHIYLGERLVDHVHPYGLVHTHPTEPAHGPSTGPGTRPGNAEGTVYLTSDDAAGSGSITVSMDAEMAFPESGDSPLLLSLADPDQPLTEPFLAVPERPPRA